MKIAPQQKGKQALMPSDRSPFYSELSPNQSQRGREAELESASYVFRGSNNDPGLNPAMITASQATAKQGVPQALIKVKDDLKLPLQSLMDKSLNSQGEEARHNQSLPDLVNSCRSLQQNQLQKEGGFFEITNERMIDHMQTFNQSMQRELYTLAKIETDASPNPEHREWHRDPPIIYQIETDIRTSKKDHPLQFYSNNAYDESTQKRIMQSIDEEMYRKLTSKGILAPQQKMIIQHPRSGTQRLKGKNFVFEQGVNDDGKSRPFTAKLKSNTKQNRHSKTSSTADQMAILNKQMSFSTNGRKPTDLREFVKINKNGQSTIISDQELQKRLAHADAAQLNNNCLLKRNPLIIEKKNFQNKHEFYQHAQQSVIKVAAQTKQSQLMLNSRNLLYGGQLRDLRGKDYSNIEHGVLFDFLDRLKKVDQSYQPKKFALTGSSRHNKKDNRSFKMYQHGRNQSSRVDQAQQMPQAAELPISDYTRCGSNRSFSDSNHEKPVSGAVKVNVKGQVSKNKTVHICTEKINLESDPRSFEVDKVQTLPQSNPQSTKNLDLIVKNQESLENANKEEVELAKLRQKHKDEMMQLQQRQLFARSSRVDQTTPRSQRGGGMVSLLSQRTREPQSVRDSQVATLVIAKEENQMEQTSTLVQFQEIGGTQIKLQSAKARCKSAIYRGQGSASQKQLNQIFLTCKTDQRHAIVADSYTVENLENSYDPERNSTATSHIFKSKNTLIGRQHRRAQAVTSFGHQRFDPHVISLNENDQGKLQLTSQTFRMPLSNKPVSHRVKGYKRQPKKSRDADTIFTCEKPLIPNNRIVLSQCSQPKILHPFSNRNLRSTRGSNEPIFVIDANAEKLVNQDINVQLINSNSFAVREIQQIQIKDQELYNEMNLQSTERHPNDMFSARQPPMLRRPQNQNIIPSQSMQAIHSSNLVKEHLQIEVHQEKAVKLVENPASKNRSKKSLTKSKSLLKSKTPLIDSNGELIKQVQIIPRSESQTQMLKNTQFGYFLTNLKFTTSQD